VKSNNGHCVDSWWKEFVRRGLEFAGYRITRLRPANRFQSMDEMLLLVRGFGFNPRVIIDAGANVGTWTRMCRKVFPDAEYHMIEPQPAYVQALQRLMHSVPAAEIHGVAVTEPGIRSVRMCGAGTTGAWVASDGENTANEVVCPAATLDELLADRVSAEDRVLLKLDLEGHEVHALIGASRLLKAVEVVLTEVQFYDINNSGRPTFSDVLEFFRQRGFEIYDIACLSQRPRDMRLRMGDVIFVRNDSQLLADRSWE
jgi:FkbM family methyltransferase